MAAAELAALPCGDQHDGVVPVGQVGDEPHGGPVMRRSSPGTEGRATLWFAGDAEEAF